MNTSLETIGVVGAGVIGRGVAQSLAESSFRVVLVDLDEDILRRARDGITEGVRYRSLFGNPSTLPLDAVHEAIDYTTTYEGLASCDAVVENVTEDWDTKRDVWTRLEAICDPGCLLAANTSAIPITRLASLSRRPDRVVGIHFMNPVPVKTMAEVVRGFHTSDEALDVTRALLSRMGKEAVVVADSPGFVSNRVLMLMVNEAICLVHEGVAPARDIDRLFKGCFGHRMGPLEVADLIGLDTILNTLVVLHDNFRDAKFRPCPLLANMTDAGLLGRKSGQGFYRY